jgi:NADH:ubiquinone oxidoreductase subunit 6 (subunit J)
MEQVGFGIIAACLVLGALFVVSGKNLIHCVLWLGVTLATTAVLFVFLGAPFLAGIQVLLYTGGVITLMLFGVMLTRRHERLMIDNETSPGRRLPAFIAAAAFFAIVAAAGYRTDELPAQLGAPTSTAEIGRSFLTDHLLAFEVLSVLLLAAMIGAIVLARRLDHGRKANVLASRNDRAA